MYKLLVKQNLNVSPKPSSSCSTAGASVDNEDSVSAAVEDEDDYITGSIDPTTLLDDQWNEMISSWNPKNNDDAAPDGYSWFGRYSFLCFGPVREKVYFSSTLALGGASNMTVAEQKAGGWTAMRKNERKRDNTNRGAGGEARGMNIGVKISAGIIAQNEESAGQQDRNLKIVSLSKQIKAARDLIGFKERMMSAMEMDMEEKRVVFKEISDLMAKIGTLTEEMRAVTNALRQMNPIVDQVLRHASASMGVTARGNATDNNEFVSSVLTDR